MFQPGTKLLADGRYEIIEPIGKGGFGVVYKAHDNHLDRLVAIKVLPNEVSEDRRAISSLKREAKLAAGLSHPNIVTVYDAPEWGQKYFIIMEYVEGKTLEDVVLDGFPLPLSQVLDILIQACAGLHYIHSSEILHRDIKPKNIMIASGGLVKIADFGIAHIIKQTVTRLTGRTTGTMPYMSPEQITARPADHRSDIYSLGVTIYEILTNDLPFPGPDFAFQHLQVEVPSPSERMPELGIPEGLSLIVMKCLRKKPEERFNSVAELSEDLVALKTGRRSPSSAANIKDLEKQAHEESTAKNFQRVIEICEQILKIDPHNASAKSGIEVARKALENQKREIEAQIAQAKQAMKSENYADAIQLWRTILEKEPANQIAQAQLKSAEKLVGEQRQRELESYIQQAQAAHRNSDFQQAIRLWKSALRLDSQNVIARNGLEIAERALGERQKQVEQLFLQAQQEESEGRLEDAIRTWGRILQIDPNNRDAEQARKVAQDILNEETSRKTEAEKRKADSERVQQRAVQQVQQTQRQVQTLVTQAQEQERAGNPERALRLWQQVLDIAPDHQIAQKRIEELTVGNKHKKIEYAVAAASLFIQNLHRDGFDRGIIGTFGDTFRVEQRFTSNKGQLQNSLGRIVTSMRSENTRLYDSIEDMIVEFWRNGAKDRPWILTIITDGQDNQSRKYRSNDPYSPARIGDFVLKRFNHEPTNFPFLIGVGDGQNIDTNALATIGEVGRFPAVTIAAFPLLEQMFLRIALQVSSQLVGRRIDFGGLTWAQVQEIRQLVQVPIDYGFLIDRSGSMQDPG